MEKVEAKIKMQSPKIKTKIIVADFSGDASIDFYRNILKQVSNLDVSIIIANNKYLVIYV